MKPGIPWSVKGIEPETREAAKDAARRSGMTLGEWLKSKILDSADEHESAPAARHQRATPARADTSIRLEDIAEQLSRIARREQNTAPAGYVSETRLRMRTSTDLNRIEQRAPTVEAFTAVVSACCLEPAGAADRKMTIPTEEPAPSSPWKPLSAILSSICKSASAAPATA
jgi:localization factor PodJL